MTSPSIYVQVASYRDPELLATVQDALARAAHPENLVFGIAWQHTPEEVIPDSWRNNPQFRILDIPHSETKGVCWARRLLQDQWQSEAFTLMLDSHHRFAEHWDALLLQMWSDLLAVGIKKPLLTGYAPSFDPRNDPAGRHKTAWQTNYDRQIPEGCFFQRPADMPGWERMCYPLRNRFFSAHFAFVEGSFCKEVPYFRGWFHGEEPNMGIRAYTHGYDLYTPHRVICWHEYTRRGRPHVWDRDEPVEKLHHEWNAAAHLLNRRLFGIDGAPPLTPEELGDQGLGTERSLEDWIKYSGIDIRNRTVQQWTLDHHPPPNPDPDAPYLRRVSHCIDLHYTPTELDDFDFLAVTFHNAAGVEVYREDAFGAEFERWKSDEDHYCKCWRSFVADPANPPIKWAVRPHSRTKGWLPLLEGVSP
jgi:hypothetical protein